MNPLLKEVPDSQPLWLLAFAPGVFVAVDRQRARSPASLPFWRGALLMIFIASLAEPLVTNSGKSSWFPEVLQLMVYLIFVLTLYLLPPGVQ